MAERSTALVTGANKGIGLEIARGLGRLGYRVWVGSRDPSRGAAAVAELRGPVAAHRDDQQQPGLARLGI